MMLKSMKKSIEEKRDNAAPSVMDHPDYPYGLKIHLDEESFAKLGMKEVPKIGESYMMLAQVEVCGLHKGNEQKMSMDLQITDMEIKKGKEESPADKLYGAE